METLKKDELNKKIAKGMMWRLFERGGIQIINFVVQLCLARLLSPEHYGTIAIINVFITISTTLINNGLCNAIINDNESDELDFNTVFFVQLLVAVIMVITLNLTAPYIAIFYEAPKLKYYLRAMTVMLLLESLTCMQLTAMRKKMDFKKSFYSNISGVLVSAIVGITLALCGFGCWALVFSSISQKLVVYIVLKVKVKWEPRYAFSFFRLKKMFKYSWKLTVAWLVGTLHNQIFSLVVGKYFSKETLGYYNKAQNLPNTVTVTANETISNVMFTALSKINDNIDNIKEYTKNMISLTSFVIFPVMAGIAGISENFILFFLTEKWAACIPMMKLFCISYGINIISTTNMQSFNSIGRTDLFLKLEVVKRTLTLLALFIVANISIYAIIVCLVVMGFFSLGYNMYYNNKLFKYQIMQQIKDLMVNLVPAVIMYILVNLVGLIDLHHLLEMIIQIVTGIVSYTLLSFLIKNKNITFILNAIKKYWEKKNKKQVN